MKKLTKHFTLLEIGGDAESPMIGTIPNITNDDAGKETFKQKFLDAVSEHFDIDDFNFDILPDLFVGSQYEDIMIEVDGANYEIRILETWLY